MTSVEKNHPNENCSYRINQALKCDLCGKNHPNENCPYRINRLRKRHITWAVKEDKLVFLTHTNRTQGWRHNLNQGFGWKQEVP